MQQLETLLLEAFLTTPAMCGALVELEKSEAGVIYVSRYTDGCGCPADRIVRVGYLDHPLCTKHAEMEWMLRAVLAWKEVPDA